MKWMKLFIPIVVILGLAACGDEDKKEENKNSKLEDGYVQVTLPKQFFEGQDEESIREDAKEQEIKDVKIHEDGSVTYTLTEERHHEILKSFKDELDFAVIDLAESESYPTIKRIDANDDYTKFDIYVNQAEFEKSADMMATITLYIGSSYYHAFLGNADNFKVTLNYVNESTEELIESVVLPEDIEKDAE